jgi:hypothetical protein
VRYFIDVWQKPAMVRTPIDEFVLVGELIVLALLWWAVVALAARCLRRPSLYEKDRQRIIREGQDERARLRAGFRHKPLTPAGDGSPPSRCS